MRRALRPLAARHNRRLLHHRFEIDVRAPAFKQLEHMLAKSLVIRHTISFFNTILDELNTNRLARVKLELWRRWF